MKNIRAAFTLIELIVVIAIIAILAAIIAPNAFRSIEKAKVARVSRDANNIKTAAYSMYSDTGLWPGSNWAETDDPLSPAEPGVGFVLDPGVDGWDGPYLEKWSLNPWGGWYWWDYNQADQNGDGIGMEHVLWIDNARNNSGHRIPLSSREKVDSSLDDGALDRGNIQVWQGTLYAGNLGYILIQGE